MPLNNLKIMFIPWTFLGSFINFGGARKNFQYNKSQSLYGNECVVPNRVPDI